MKLDEIQYSTMT